MQKMSIREIVIISIKLVWLLLCCVSLISFFNNDKAYFDSEVVELYYLKMLALTFPMGYIADLFTSILLLIFHWLLKESSYWNYINTSILWFSMVCAGYVQWFIWIPLMYKKLRTLTTR